MAEGGKVPVTSEKKAPVPASTRAWHPFENLREEVDQGKIEASFQKGVLKVVLPKTAEAQKKTKKIAIGAK